MIPVKQIMERLFDLPVCDIVQSTSTERSITLCQLPQEPPNGLTIKISTSCSKTGKGISTLLASSNSDLPSPNLKNSIESSPLNSPSLVSPPSSAFVSALQSPYISPRAITPKPTPPENPTPVTYPSPQVSSYRGSQSDDIPSSSYTLPSDQYEYSDDPADAKLKYVTCVPVPDPAPPRISFSFPVPRISFKGSVSPASNAKLRSCDVYIGFHGQNPNLIRFCKWLKSELELQGIACFVADRSKYSDQNHEIADRVISSVAYGIVVVTNSSFLNHLSLERLDSLLRKNLIPIFFGTELAEIMGLLYCNSIDKECKEAIGLLKYHEFKLETNEANWRSCVAKAAGLLRAKLGRKSVAEKDEIERLEELPFPRNKSFVGREKEIMEIETALFGCGDTLEHKYSIPIVQGEAHEQSGDLGNDESETAITQGERYINLEFGGKCKEPALEAWVEPVIGRNSWKRSKHKKSKSGNYKCLGCSSVFCINGVAGIGKTELALEFAYRYSQRYKMILWVGGEARYLRQNILNLSLNLGLDVSADGEKERERIRSFEEQEFEAFKRVKRELFRDVPYLLIMTILRQKQNGGKGRTYAMILMRGRRKKDYQRDELEFLQKFDEKLGRLSFGLWVIGSLLSEFSISPSELFEAQTNGTKNVLASRMLLVGAWFAPAPISVTLLATAAKDMPTIGNRFKKWTKCLSLPFACCSGCGLAPQSEEDSAILLVKLGLARKANRHPACWIQFHPITQVFARRKKVYQLPRPLFKE
ncbi:hypothetical protein GH714_032510 [Hevea brasiliensis]|uniref:Plant disease resistance WDH domain-containing protein n=1 Tax=Hevea brasiliensis TaxID=3981 RepID=A0A6A6NLI2_HEVBR|nr:hypothetical protein GH714_032510 [Hevea brasiliensis]